MDWPNIALDWVNSLRLTENLKVIKELGDGKFLCEVLQILFHKTVNVKNKAQVFHILKISLKDLYTPPDWINFEDAHDGNVDELLKIVTVLIGVSSLQSEEKLFLEKPSTHLNNDAQVVLTKFLKYVLDNGKVVDSRFIGNLEERENNSSSSNRRASNAAPKVCQTPTQKGETVFESPHNYSFSPSKDWDSPQKSPLRDFLSSPDRTLMSEKDNQIFGLRKRIEVLTACQRDLMDDITSYREESSKLSQRCDKLEKENQSLRIKCNLNKTFTLGSPRQSETPEKMRDFANNLKDKLKVSENYMEVLESKIDEGNNTILKLEEDIATLKGNLQQASIREGEMLKELENDEIEKHNLQSQIENTNEIIKKLSQEIEDCKDSQQMNRSDNHYGANELLGLSICDSFDTSVCSKSLGLSTCEDMASAVIEVQLRETQSTLKDTETTLAQTKTKLEIMESRTKKTEVSMKNLEIKLQEKTNLLQTTNDTLANVEVKLEEMTKSLNAKNKLLESTEFKLNEMSSLLEAKNADLEASELKLAETTNLLQEKNANLEASELKLADTTNLLEKRTINLEASELKLSETTNSLQEKTANLEAYQAKLAETCNLLQDKTTNLEASEHKLAEATILLEQKKADLEASELKFAETTNLLEEGTANLESSELKLAETTNLLEERTINLEASELKLAETANLLEERTANLEASVSGEGQGILTSSPTSVVTVQGVRLPGGGQHWWTSKRVMRVAHHIFSWGWMWGFAVWLCMVILFTNSLLLTAIYGFCNCLSSIILGPYIGEWIDKTQRITATRASVVVQNSAVVLGSTILTVTLFYRSQIQGVWNGRLEHVLFAVIITVAIVAELASVVNKIALEKDWIFVLAGGDNKQLSNSPSEEDPLSPEHEYEENDSHSLLQEKTSLSTFPQKVTDSADYHPPSPKSEVNADQEMETEEVNDFFIQSETEETFQADDDPDYAPSPSSTSSKNRHPDVVLETKKKNPVTTLNCTTKQGDECTEFNDKTQNDPNRRAECPTLSSEVRPAEGKKIISDLTWFLRLKTHHVTSLDFGGEIASKCDYDEQVLELCSTQTLQSFKLDWTWNIFQASGLGYQIPPSIKFSNLTTFILTMDLDDSIDDDKDCASLASWFTPLLDSVKGVRVLVLRTFSSILNAFCAQAKQFSNLEEVTIKLTQEGLQFLHKLEKPLKKMKLGTFGNWKSAEYLQLGQLLRKHSRTLTSLSLTLGKCSESDVILHLPSFPSLKELDVGLSDWNGEDETFPIKLSFDGDANIFYAKHFPALITLKLGGYDDTRRDVKEGDDLFDKFLPLGLAGFQVCQTLRQLDLPTEATSEEKGQLFARVGKIARMFPNVHNPRWTRHENHASK